MIYGKYSIIGIYRKWKNGTPISEIVEITGIKRKTWNKRFERLEKKIKLATNVNSELNIKNNANNLIKNNGDSGDKSDKNVAQGDRNNFLLLIFIVVLILVFSFLIERIYDQLTDRKKNVINSENNNENVAA